MAVLSRRNFGNVEILRVSSNPNGSVSAAAVSLAKNTNTNAVYQSVGGTSWMLVSSSIINVSQISGGSSGENGAQGAQGPQGAQGSQGSQGISSLLQGPTGDVGPQGAQGPIGHNGTPGAQGQVGHVGSQGQQGSSGHAGAQGLQGPQGSQGASSGVGGGAGLTLISSQVITGSAVTSVTFSGLDGDVDKNYYLRCFIRNVTAGSLPVYVNLKPNGSTSNHRNAYYVQNGSTQSSGVVGATAVIQILQGTAGVEGISFVEIGARSGAKRTFKIDSTAKEPGAGALRSFRWMGNLLDSSTNITSLVIDTMSNNATSENAIGVGSEFYLYKYEV